MPVNFWTWDATWLPAALATADSAPTDAGVDAFDAAFAVVCPKARRLMISAVESDGSDVYEVLSRSIGPFRIYGDGVLIDDGTHRQVYDRLGTNGIAERDRSALNFQSLPQEEHLAAGERHSAKHYRIR